MAKEERRRIAAIKVHQWLAEWDEIKFSPEHRRREPEHHFYIFSIPAVELRALCGINRRQVKGVGPRSADMGIQREHEPERSDEIARYVKYGFPWSTLRQSQRELSEYKSMRKPGWLPTAIVVNILQSSDKRDDQVVTNSDLLTVEEGSGVSHLQLPYQKWDKDWRPSGYPPLEVIDGQHRLWAFENDISAVDYEVPVVAFNGLDISWQAYLFWTINIKPKRINPSLAFDLYPLLRAEDWLDKAEGHQVYRDTRAQELAETLWSYPASPWYDKIDMLGEGGTGYVKQAAWIRTLTSTFIRKWDGHKDKPGGLFGSRLGEHDNDDVLNWSRSQQAAFLIYTWQAIREQINNSKAEWISHLRKALSVGNTDKNEDFAFYGRYSLISTDQGVRGYLQAVNDLCFVNANRLKLNKWRLPAGSVDDEAVSLGLKSIKSEPVAEFLQSIAKGAVTFDWRVSSAPGLSEEDRREKLIFRGGSGYKELRLLLLRHLSAGGDEMVVQAANRLLPKAN